MHSSRPTAHADRHPLARPVLGVALAMALVLLPAPRAEAANLLVNGSFEDPVIAGVEFFPAIPGWNETTGFLIEMHRSAVGGPAEGAQHVELDSNGPSVLVQDVPTTAGLSYDIVFWFSARPGVADNATRLSWDGAVIDTVRADGTGLPDSSWMRHVYTVVATADTTLLQFADASAADSVGSYLDDVCVAEAADPPGSGCLGPCVADLGTRSPVLGCEAQELRLLPVRARVEPCAGEPEYRWTRGAEVLRDWDRDPTYFHVVEPFDELLTVEVRCSVEPDCLAAGDVEVLVSTPMPAEPVGNRLRVTREDPAVRLTWEDAAVAADGEHFHAYRSTQPDAGFTLPEHSLDLVTATWLDVSPVGPLLFYDVRAADACENESPD